MKSFGLVFFISLFLFIVVMMRIEIYRSGHTIGKLQQELEIKQARNQYLELEATRLSGPMTIRQIAQDKLNLRTTPPQQIMVLDK